MQGQKAEGLCTYLKSKQILRFGFAQQHTYSLIPGYDVNNIYYQLFCDGINVVFLKRH